MKQVSLYLSVHSEQRVETKKKLDYFPVFTNKWRSNDNVVYEHSGIIIICKNELKLYTTPWMDMVTHDTY